MAKWYEVIAARCVVRIEKVKRAWSLSINDEVSRVKQGEELNEHDRAIVWALVYYIHQQLEPKDHSSLCCCKILSSPKKVKNTEEFPIVNQRRLGLPWTQSMLPLPSLLLPCHFMFHVFFLNQQSD